MKPYLGVALVLLIVGCSSGGGGKPDGGAGKGGAGTAGTAGATGGAGANGGSGTAGSAGNGDAGTGAAGTGVVSDGGDAPVGDGAGGTTSASDGGDAPVTMDATDRSAAKETRPPGTYPDYASGTRLRARVYQTADGDKLWHGWRDSMRDENCAFLTAEDGKLRCLPEVEQYVQYFADDKCAEPLILGVACRTPAYAALDAMGCGATAFYKRGAKVTPAKVYSRSGTNCMEATAPDAHDLYATTKQDATAFVAATEVHDPRGALSARDYEAEDGALQPLGPWDPAASQSCTPLGPDLADRCVPSPMPTLSVRILNHTEMMCMSPLYTRFKNACGTYPVSIGTVSTYDDQAPLTCSGDYDRTYYRLGAEYTGPTFSKGTGTCMSVNRPPNTATFAFAAKITAADMPALQLVDVGAGRLKLHYLASATSEKVYATSFFDTMTGMACAAVMSNGTLRCVPQGAQTSYFADDQCKMAYYWRNKRQGCTLPAPPAWAISWEESVCDGIGTYVNPHLYAVGAEKTVGIGSVFFLSGDRCVTSGLDPNGLQFFDTTEHPTSELAPLTDVTE